MLTLLFLLVISLKRLVKLLIFAKHYWKFNVTSVTETIMEINMFKVRAKHLRSGRLQLDSVLLFNTALLLWLLLVPFQMWSVPQVYGSWGCSWFWVNLVKDVGVLRYMEDGKSMVSDYCNLQKKTPWDQSGFI